MKIINLLFSLCCLFTFCSSVQATAVVTKHTNNTATTINNLKNLNDIYLPDLNRVELFLYRKTYPKLSIYNRLSKIERTIFSNSFDNFTIAQRMNNILANYKLTKNYARDYYQTNPVTQRLHNRFLGFPTGVTPSFSNYYGPGIINENYSNRGFSYSRDIPAMVGGGIKILD